MTQPDEPVLAVIIAFLLGVAGWMALVFAALLVGDCSGPLGP